MLGLLGDEWNLLILQQALMGAHRYSHFAARLPISHAVLSNRLRVLVNEEMLTADYRPTPRSRTLWPMLLAIWEWELTWVAEHRQLLPVMHHEVCGERFSPVLRCANCRRPVSAGDIDLTPGPSGTWERSAPRAVTRRRSDSDSRTVSPGSRSLASAQQAGLFPETMCVLGNRWAAALLVAAFLGTARFTDFQAQLGVPPSLLTHRLQTFCAIGVLTLDAADGAEYVLTAKGRAFFGVLVAALQWSQRWFHAPEGPAMTLTHSAHSGCGQPFTGEFSCDHCNERLRGTEVLDIPATASAAAASGNP
jgi:DNA-binding HxlR family transcriptional regulator